MSVNSTNDIQTLESFIFAPEFTCSNITVGRYILTVMALTYTLIILPLSAFILYLGFQQWREQRLVSSAAAVTYSDFFTYNMAVIELIGVCGYTLYYCSIHINNQVVSLLGDIFVWFTWAGQTLFPIVTCVERYLAVVYPITYRALRQRGGIRIRNITTGCIWLMSVSWVAFLILLYIHNYYNLIPSVIMLTLFLIAIMFCSLSVLRVLIRQRPGKVGRDGVQVDQSKRRAIRTIRIIMGFLCLRFGGCVVAIMTRFSTLVSVKCVGEASIIMFCLAGSLVLPMLFLQRAGKLPKCKHSTG